MIWVLFVAAVLIPLSDLVSGEDDSELVVDTKLGKVRGQRMTSREGRQFLAFTAIPYAKPPVGDLRFQPPEPADPWEGIRDATVEVPYCLSINTYDIDPKVEGVEDCLVLSVFTHNISRRAPVIVHIHGGGFVSGSGNGKPLYLMDKDLVIVEINYRLGILGFLSFEDGAMPGNQGMKDQTMALRWVQENVERFGGDPDCVTIAGESAGGYSVYHHTVSPLSRGLFHRAIAESGTSYDPGSLMAPGYVKEQSYKLAAFTDCTRNSTEEIVNCFREMDPVDLVSQLVKYRVWQVDPLLTFRPVIEPEGPGAFLTGKISEWNHAQVPLLTGVTAAEGLLRALYFIEFNMDFNWYSDNFNKVAPSSLGYYASSSKPAEVTEKLRRFYLPGAKISFNNWPKIVQMYTDSMFIIGGIMGADNHKDKVYFYYFDYLGEYTFAGNYNKSVVVGAYHVDEMIYLWPSNNIKGKDLELSKKLVRMWFNFASFGNPSLEESDVTWDAWSPDKHNYLHISNDGFKMEEQFVDDRYQLWRNLPYRDKLL